MPLKTLVAILALMGCSAQAVEWKLISTSSDTAKTTYWYVDPESIVVQSNWVQARLRTVWSTMQYASDNTGYQSSVYLNYVDCKRRAIAFTGNTYFTDAASMGPPVHQEPELPLSALSFQAVKPGSAGEVRVNYLCRSNGSSSNNLT